MIASLRCAVQPASNRVAPLLGLDVHRYTVLRGIPSAEATLRRSMSVPSARIRFMNALGYFSRTVLARDMFFLRFIGAVVTAIHMSPLILKCEFGETPI